jgi:Asp-tRNA(Asn)/Glu-tRNA(Gln) amidotransferase A subunit family amidase
MSDLIDRLRTNLRIAGITVTDADLAGIEAKGFLRRVPDVAQALDAAPNMALPDYLDAGSLPLPPRPTAIEEARAGRPPAADTILAVAAQVAAQERSPVELTEAALAQIAAKDAELNAFQLVLADTALADAQRAEAAIAADAYIGPLHGIPVAVKDLLDLAGTPTRAGSSFYGGGEPAATDATAVARLRAAGAIIIGKTRLSEFAYSPGSNNAHYGATGNPHNPTRDTGGSSSGSAAATASGMAYAALGTDTGCSIRIPAAFCGLVGLKPTWGRTSLAGGVTLSWSLDHLGPLTRSVADAALVLRVLAGPDPADGRTLRNVPPFVAGDLSGNVRGLRVGVLTDDGSGSALADAEQLAAVARGAAALQAAGAQVQELALPELDGLRVVGGAILGLEAAALHLPWLRTRINDYGEFMRQRVLAAFAYEAGTFVRAQQARAALRRRISERFAAIDVLLTPIHPGPVPERGVPATNGLAIPFNCLGWPALTMPVGTATDGMPLALQIVGRPWEEATILSAAAAVELALAT